MRALSWSLFVLVVVPVAACQGEVAGPRAHPDLFLGPAGGELDLGLGQSARLGQEGVAVRFEGVREDSRCPTGVTCVWQGNGRIALAIQSEGAAARTIELNTTLEPRRASVRGWRLELIELKPWPDEGAPIPEERYFARLTVSRP